MRACACLRATGLMKCWVRRLRRARAGALRARRPLRGFREERVALAVLRRRDGGAHQRGDGADGVWVAAGPAPLAMPGLHVAVRAVACAAEVRSASAVCALSAHAQRPQLRSSVTHSVCADIMACRYHKHVMWTACPLLGTYRVGLPSALAQHTLTPSPERGSSEQPAGVLVQHGPWVHFDV